MLFLGQPLSSQCTVQHPEVSHLCVVLDTSSQSVAPVVEAVVHAPPAGVCPTGGSGLRLGVVSGPCSHVLPLSVDRQCNQASLPADVFGSPDHDMDLGGDAMAPLEHHLASGPSSSPHPLLNTIQATSGKRSVVHVTLPQVHPLPKCVC